MDVIKAINSFLQEYSGIFVSLGIIAAFIAMLSKRFKNWVFNDIYSRLDKIENNDLQHNDKFHAYSLKMIGLILDVMAEKVSKEDIESKRAAMAEEYTRDLEELLKEQPAKKVSK
jgi:fructose-1,6-bisphosphatase